MIVNFNVTLHRLFPHAIVMSFAFKEPVPRSHAVV